MKKFFPLFYWGKFKLAPTNPLRLRPSPNTVLVRRPNHSLVFGRPSPPAYPPRVLPLIRYGVGGFFREMSTAIRTSEATETA